MSTSNIETINAKDKPIAEDFVYVYSEIEDGGFRKVSKEMLKMLLGVATKLSELDNDQGFVAKSVADLENYYLKAETYSKDEIDNRISLIPKFNVQVVQSLPIKNISEETVYLLPSGNDADNLYTEYLYVNGLWEIIGSQKIAPVENAILYIEQNLSDTQKSQARSNIDAASETDVREKSKILKGGFSDLAHVPVLKIYQMTREEYEAELESGNVEEDALYITPEEKYVTHKWNGTVLSITSASGTSSADLKGAKGDAFKYSDFTPEQLASLKGEKGDTPILNSETWTFTLEDGSTVNKVVYVG